MTQVADLFMKRPILLTLLLCLSLYLTELPIQFLYLCILGLKLLLQSLYLFKQILAIGILLLILFQLYLEILILLSEQFDQLTRLIDRLLHVGTIVLIAPHVHS